jgi:hypothetical protein
VVLGSTRPAAVTRVLRRATAGTGRYVQAFELEVKEAVEDHADLTGAACRLEKPVLVLVHSQTSGEPGEVGNRRGVCLFETAVVGAVAANVASPPVEEVQAEARAALAAVVLAVSISLAALWRRRRVERRGSLKSRTCPNIFPIVLDTDDRPFHHRSRVVPAAPAYPVPALHTLEATPADRHEAPIMRSEIGRLRLEIGQVLCR